MFQSDIRDNSENEKVCRDVHAGHLHVNVFRVNDLRTRSEQWEKLAVQLFLSTKIHVMLSQKCILSGSGEPEISLIIQC